MKPEIVSKEDIQEMSEKKITREGKCPVRRLIGHTCDVMKVIFSPDGKLLASGSWDTSVRIWDVQKGKSIHTLEGHNGRIIDVSFSPDGNLLASCDDQIIKIWDVQSGECKLTLGDENNWEWRLGSVIFSPDGKFLASCSRNKFGLWDTSTWEYKEMMEGKTFVECLSFSSDGKYLVSSSTDRTIRVWDVLTKKCESVLEDDNEDYTNYSCLSFSPDGKYLASGCYFSIKIWDMSTKKIHTIIGDCGDDMIYSVDFSSDGNLLISSSLEEGTILWSTKTFDCLHKFESSHGNYSSTFSPDRLSFASCFDDDILITDISSLLEKNESNI